jgi:hypothetical protein
MKIIVTWFDADGHIIAMRQYLNSSLPKMSELATMFPQADRFSVR